MAGIRPLEMVMVDVALHTEEVGVRENRVGGQRKLVRRDIEPRCCLASSFLALTELRTLKSYVAILGKEHLLYSIILRRSTLTSYE